MGLEISVKGGEWLKVQSRVSSTINSIDRGKKFEAANAMLPVCQLDANHIRSSPLGNIFSLVSPTSSPFD